MSEVLQISKTKLEMFQRCGEQYRRRYILGERRPPGVAAVVGRAVDGAANTNLRHKMETGDLLPVDVVKDVARDTFAHEWEFGVILTDEEASEGLAKVKGQNLDRSITLATQHSAGLAPGIMPTAVQRGLAVEMERVGTPVSLVTVIDVQEGPRRVRDLKTSRRRPTADVAHKSLQLTVEAMAVSVHDGAPPERLALDYVVATKTMKTSVATLETVRGPDDFRGLLARVDRFVEAHKTGSFPPTNPDNWWCSLEYCGYAPTCPYFRRPESVVAGEFDLLELLKKSVNDKEDR